MNKYEWNASSQDEREDAINAEMDACAREDSSTFDTGVRQLRHDIPPISEAITKPSLWTRFLRRIGRTNSAQSAEKNNLISGP